MTASSPWFVCVCWYCDDNKFRVILCSSTVYIIQVWCRMFLSKTQGVCGFFLLPATVLTFSFYPSYRLHFMQLNRHPLHSPTIKKNKTASACVFDAPSVCCMLVRGRCAVHVKQRGNMHLLFADRYNNLTLSNQSVFLCTGTHSNTKQTLKRGEEGKMQREHWGK